MTMAPPQPFPTIPPLDPSNPVQMYCYFTGWLYALGDEQAIKESNEEIGAWAAALTDTVLTEGMAAAGFKRGNPQQRYDAYVRKYHWPTDRGPDGMLLHPVMTTQVDPETLQPVQVPSQTEGEDLWSLQLQMFPRQFLIDARDAFDMGAPLPPWVLQEVVATKQAEQTPQGKTALVSALKKPAYGPKKALARVA